jgi:predicted peptidase
LGEKYLKTFICALFTLLVSGLSIADIIQIPSPYGNTAIAYWPSSDSKATLIFLPGGDGSFNIATKNLEKPPWVLSKLYDASQISPGFDIVFLDSPYSLGWQGGNVAPRYSKDHLSRILSVIQFYKNKLSKPIYLIGHSNGAISLSAFLNQSPENQKLLAGVIFSGSRNETFLDDPLNVPILFLHHEDDANGRWTSYSQAEKLYKKVKVINYSITEFSTVHGGESGGDPSTSGHHMYQGSFDEAANYIWNFSFKQDIYKSQ